MQVEGGRIDQAHHANMARLALEETLELEAAVEVALQTVDLAETLILVGADHSHAFTINGYPGRGNDILGRLRTAAAAAADFFDQLVMK